VVLNREPNNNNNNNNKNKNKNKNKNNNNNNNNNSNNNNNNNKKRQQQPRQQQQQQQQQQEQEQEQHQRKKTTTTKDTTQPEQGQPREDHEQECHKLQQQRLFVTAPTGSSNAMAWTAAQKRSMRAALRKARSPQKRARLLLGGSGGKFLLRSCAFLDHSPVQRMEGLIILGFACATRGLPGRTRVFRLTNC